MGDYDIASVLYEEALEQYNKALSSANEFVQADMMLENMSLVRIAMLQSVLVDDLGHEEEESSSSLSDDDVTDATDTSSVVMLNETRTCINEFAI